MNRAARALDQCLSQAIAALEPRPLSDAAVHAARKALKRARAALRLLRPSLGEAAYRRHNARLRQAGRYLAPLRHNASLLGALEDLRRRFPGRLRGDAGLARQLVARRERARQKMDRARGLGRWLAVLARSRSVTRHPLAAAAGDAEARRGLRRVYRTGRNAFRKARAAPEPEALHEWRKQVKYLANALSILEPRGTLMRAAKSRTETLGEQLGEHHDLSELVRLVPKGAGMRKLIDELRASIAERALHTGAELYRPRPRQFVRRVRGS